MVDPWLFVLAALTIYYVLNAWLYGSLFEKWRAVLEARDVWWARLLACGLCLAPYIATAIGLLVVLPYVLLPGPWNMIFGLLLLVLGWAGMVHFLAQISK